MRIKQLALCSVLLWLCCGTSSAVLLKFVVGEFDDASVIQKEKALIEDAQNEALSNACAHLLETRIELMKPADMEKAFGRKLDAKPLGLIKPLFTPSLIVESGLAPVDNNKRHTDYHALRNIGYLELHYDWTGETVSAAILWFQPDMKFIPVTSAQFIPSRKIWEKAKFDALSEWMESHLPKMIDLGEISISPSAEPTRINLGTNGVWTFTPTPALAPLTGRAHSEDAGFCRFLIEQQLPNSAATNEIHNYLVRLNEANTFRLDGKFYAFVPKLGSMPEPSDNSP